MEIERHSRDDGGGFAGGVGRRRGRGGRGGDEKGLGVAGGPAGGGAAAGEGEGGAERVRRGEDLVEALFVVGEFADQVEDGGDICTKKEGEGSIEHLWW